MTTKEITDQLERIVSTEDFPSRSAELVNSWIASDVEVEAVEPILQFMEGHPFIDYGAPGALVHFVEKFYARGYETKLVESVKRRPTTTTVWMLNRVINGTKAADAKRNLIGILEQSAVNPLADQNTRQTIIRSRSFNNK